MSPSEARERGALHFREELAMDTDLIRWLNEAKRIGLFQVESEIS
jgi:hypothetical protein